MTEHGSAMNGGAAMRDGEGSEDERRTNHGNNPMRKVDQEDLFQECPNSEQGIMAGVEITGVNVSRGVNWMSVSTGLDASFQAQLEEIDNALNIFETAGGRAEVGPNRDQDLGVDGLGQMGQQDASFGPLDSKNDQDGYVGIKGRRWAQGSLNKGSSGTKREPMKLKRNLCEYLEDENQAVSYKKKRSETDNEISVEAGFQPRWTQ